MDRLYNGPSEFRALPLDGAVAQGLMFYFFGRKNEKWLELPEMARTLIEKCLQRRQESKPKYMQNAALYILMSKRCKFYMLVGERYHLAQSLFPN